MERYDPRAIEAKWQKKWEESHLYVTTEEKNKPKSYVLDMFPYPSGDGLHVGHPKGYIATDVYARFKRMTGHNVLHPMGWDAFGLPAENYALKNKVHPRVAVEKNIARFKEQLQLIGLNYDWSREINTTDPAYYKWTQWMFLKLLEKGLAFQSEEPINWCPSCKTGLANEDLENGVCERCGTPVEQRKMLQWVIKITDYADRLLNDLELLPEWPEHIKESQRNWIGRSEGAEIDFKLATGEKVTVFTTRPDTLFGATYLVLAPEHPLLPTLAIENKKEVFTYIEAAAHKTEIERTAEGREKTGVEIKGVKAINPANNEEIPIFVADYVLGGYGTGAIMAVPAHDERDFEFAKKFDLPIKEVIGPVFTNTTGKDAARENEPFIERNVVISIVKHWKEDKYLCLRWKQAEWKGFIVGGVEEGEDVVTAGKREVAEETGYTNAKFIKKIGAVHSKFFHQIKKQNRFAHCEALYFELENDVQNEVAEDEKAIHEAEWISGLDVEKYIEGANGDVSYVWNRFLNEGAYTGNGILTNSGEFNGQNSEDAKKKITEHTGGRWTTHYKLRDWVFSRQRYWGEPIPVVHCEKDGIVPVPEKDLPVLLPEVESYQPTGTGESPLAAMTDWVNTTCPKCGGPAKRETNTMPQWAGSSWYFLRYIDPKNDTAAIEPVKEKYWMPVDLYVGGAEHATRHLIYARFWHKFLEDIGLVHTPEPFMRLHSVGLILAEDGRKMSKRFGNVINPDDVIAHYGADAFRAYEMFMGPFDNAIAWSTASIVGTRRFIERVWALVLAAKETDVPELETLLHQTIKKVGEDIEAFKFNTAISQMMIFLNAAEKSGIGKEQATILVRLLAPFAPHVAEELWEHLGGEYSVHTAPWPSYDAKKAQGDSVRIVVQINGKVRATFDAPQGVAQEEMERLAQEVIAEKLKGSSIARTIVVPGRLVNFVLAQT